MRRVLFWMHLSAGVLAGALILFFSVTGALLAYERQIVHAADKRFYQPDFAASDAPRLPLDDALAHAMQTLPALPEMVTVYQDSTWPVEIQTSNRTTYFVDRRSGQVQGHHARAPFSLRSPPCIAGLVWPMRTIQLRLQ